MLPWCGDGKVPHCPLIFLFMRQSGFCFTHFQMLRQSPWWQLSFCPPPPWFYGLAKAMWGWGRMVCCVCCACLCMCKRGCATLSRVKSGLCKAEYSFTVLICHGVPSSLQIQCPDTLNAGRCIPKLWIQNCYPRDQLNISTVCLNVCMAVLLLLYLNYVF